MKHRLLVAWLVLAVAACDDKESAKSDGGLDDGGSDGLVAVDASERDTQSADTGSGAGADAAEPTVDGSTADAGTSDGGGGSDAGSPDVVGGGDGSEAGGDGGRAVGAMCGAASREMLCLTYCDGIGRFCTGGDKQYGSADECRTACNGTAWACGKQGELTGSSLFCRLAHTALAGVGSAAKECANAGPRSPACQ
jgi:hypothetical protein